VQDEINHLGQPVGGPLPDWTPPAPPPREALVGEYCRVEPLDADRHAAALVESGRADPDGRNWTYLPYGPFDDFERYRGWLDGVARTSDPLFFAVVDNSSGTAVGVASYLRIDPRNGSVEVGHLNFSPVLRRTPAATEAMYLMMARAFGLGYRRYEWKCDALNAPSRRAALRLGLSFEGVFRQAAVYKGRNRDTAWYAATDRDWPALRAAFRRWLDPANFDERGRQRVALSALTSPHLEQNGAGATGGRERPEPGAEQCVEAEAHPRTPLLRLLGVTGQFAVCKLPPDSPVPPWATAGDLSSVTRTADELSVVCRQEVVPDGVVCERDWRCLRVAGSMPFTLVGVLAALTAPVARAGIGVFVVSTFDTDFLLVKDGNYPQAVAALRADGHAVEAGR
jgi:RimJ/RimL family protein N-acetyltransferase